MADPTTLYQYQTSTADYQHTNRVAPTTKTVGIPNVLPNYFTNEQWKKLTDYSKQSAIAFADQNRTDRIAEIRKNADIGGTKTMFEGLTYQPNTLLWPEVYKNAFQSSPVASTFMSSIYTDVYNKPVPENVKSYESSVASGTPTTAPDTTAPWQTLSGSAPEGYDPKDPTTQMYNPLNNWMSNENYFKLPAYQKDVAAYYATTGQNDKLKQLIADPTGFGNKLIPEVPYTNEHIYAVQVPLEGGGNASFKASYFPEDSVVRTGGTGVGIQGGSTYYHPGGGLGEFATGGSTSTTTSGFQGPYGSTAAADPFTTDQQQLAEDVAIGTSAESLSYQNAISEQEQAAQMQEQELEALNAQYADLTQQYADMDSEYSTYLDQLGGTARRQIKEERDKMVAATTQDMISRGLTGTSVTTNILRGVEGETAAMQGQLEASLRDQKMQARKGWTAEALGAEAAQAQFEGSMADTLYGAGLESLSSRQAWAQMMAQQRMAGWQTQAEIQKALNEQKDESYAAQLSLLANRAKLDTQSALAKAKLTADKELGYASLQSQTGLAKSEAAAGLSAAAAKAPKRTVVEYSGGWN